MEVLIFTVLCFIIGVAIVATVVYISVYEFMNEMDEDPLDQDNETQDNIG